MKFSKNNVVVIMGLFISFSAFSVNAYEFDCSVPDIRKMLQTYQLEYRDNPNSVVTMKNLAGCYLANRHTKQAQEIITKILANNNNDIDGLLLQGKLHFKQKNWGEARSSYAQAIELDNKNKEALEYMSSILYNLGENSQNSSDYNYYQSLSNQLDSGTLQGP